MNNNASKAKTFFMIIVYIILAISAIAFVIITTDSYIPTERLARTLPLSIIIGTSMIAGAILLAGNKKEN